MLGKIIHLEWRNLKSSRWTQIGFLLMFILVFLAVFNRSHHYNEYVQKAEQAKQSEQEQVERFAAVYDSVSTGLLEIDSQLFDPTFPYSIELRIIPQAVFEPSGLAVLAAGQGDIHADIYSVRTFSDPINKATVYYNPLSDLFGGFDFAFVLVFLIPLVVIAYSYDILSSERERGTLRMIMAQPVSILSVLSGKLLFRLLVLLGSVLLILIFSLIVTGTSINEQAGGIAALAGLITLYITFWFAVSLLVNLFGKSSSFNATVLTGIWVLYVLMIPTLLHLMVQQLHDIPPRSEALVEIRNTEEEVYARDRDEILDRYFLEHPEYITTSESAGTDEQWRERFEFGKWLYVVRLNIAEATTPIADEYYTRLTRQQEFARRVSAFSPGVILKEAMSGLVGTSAAHYNHFHASTEQYRLEWMGYIGDLLFREAFVTPEDIEGLPRFHYSSSDVNTGVSGGGLALFLHLGLILLLILVFGKKGRPI